MTNERDEIMRRMNAGMCAMSDAQMSILASEQKDGLRNAWPDRMDSGMLAQASVNFWRQEGQFIPAPIRPSPTTTWKRFRLWISAITRR
jgi:hypothetical protein